MKQQTHKGIPTIEKVLEQKPLENIKKQELDFIISKLYETTDVFKVMALKHLYFVRLGEWMKEGYDITEYWQKYRTYQKGMIK